MTLTRRVADTPRCLDALNSPERLKALEQLQAVGALARQTLDRSAGLAARLLEVGVVLVTLVEGDRQRLTQYIGSRNPRTTDRTMPLDWGFCPLVVAQARPLVIGDVRGRTGHARNPAVTQTGMRAYLAVPLTLDGQAVGALCVVDRRPRRWTGDQLRTLGELATAAMAEIRLLLDSAESARLNEQAESARRRSRQLQDLAQASVEINSARSLDDLLGTVTEQARALVGTHQALTALTTGRARPVTAISLSDRYARWRDPESFAVEDGLYAEVCRHNVPLRLGQGELRGHPAWCGQAGGRHPPLRDWLAVPLVDSAGGNVGLIQLSDKRDGGDFTVDDEAMLIQLAELAAACIEKTAALERQREIARTLQQSLLPPRLPDIPGVELAARYHPATGDAQVGGDFYDLFAAGGGRWGVVLGDVCGKDAEAAALTALIRHTARAAVLADPDPARVAEVLNQAVLGHGTERFCTLVYLTLSPEEGRIRVRMAVCGHPLPLRVDPRGRVREAGRPGMLIGVLPEPEVRPSSFVLEPGETLMLFTDGIAEARGGGRMFGETRLPSLLRGGATAPLPELADIISRAALDYQGGRLKDDIATLFIRAAG
ncbi:hypothetical protein Sru01_42240 [Sphaerisporangium rufum]|uniref:GAF domain-containing protein n=1 Tax=Sphaerisporangium rufum TaxID=1381558 RepID=A0A919V222_9ACTN|nr:SpoIIE family protein phosphatase [Sphaerisporangium rufum]GII79242.1 hypothetical protein Sru01_42240 [Sphaerisporangium rufum]